MMCVIKILPTWRRDEVYNLFIHFLKSLRTQCTKHGENNLTYTSKSLCTWRTNHGQKYLIHTPKTLHTWQNIFYNSCTLILLGKSICLPELLRTWRTYEVYQILIHL